MFSDSFPRLCAYLSCLSAVSLFATSMAIAAVNVGAAMTDAASAHAATLVMHAV